MEIKDPTGLGKALEKFIETVGQGVGGISRPYLTRKNADAKAYEIRVLAAANADAMKLLVDAQNYSRVHDVSIIVAGNELKEITQSDVPLLPERAETRREFLEAKKQHNIEEITSNALEELSETKSANEISDEPVDPDWISRFFNIAEDINTEEMQRIWGKILAGEIKKPKSFSLRTLDVLKNLTVDEAQLFTKVANLCIKADKEMMILSPQGGEYLKRRYGFSFSDWMLLEEVGLMKAEDLTLSFSWAEDGPEMQFIYGNILVAVEYNPDRGTRFALPIKSFTRAGEQLLSLIQVEVDTDYIERLIDEIKEKAILIKTAEIIGHDGNNLILRDWDEINNA